MTRVLRIVSCGGSVELSGTTVAGREARGEALRLRKMELKIVISKSLEEEKGETPCLRASMIKHYGRFVAK